MSVRVSAPCRLHFGLFHVPVPGLTHGPDGRPVRKFGGVGLMVETPRVKVTAQRSEGWDRHGNLSYRAIVFESRLRERMPVFQGLDYRFDIVAEGPPEHVGLGIGTALGMATAWAMWNAHFESVGGASAAFGPFAEALGRGCRSGIGVHGFGHGGLIVDDGKVEDELPRLAVRLAFPTEWRCVLIRPPEESRWHGDHERAAFGRNRTPEQALATTERLRAIADTDLIPAVEQTDFDRFAEAVHEFNRLAGEPFAADQGGAYSSMAVNCVIDELLGWGVTGVGQSSWGPTVFAFARDADEADHLAGRLRARLPADADVTVTAADNRGARIETR